MALAEQFNVSRITSKKALETLEQDGHNRALPGQGVVRGRARGWDRTAPAPDGRPGSHSSPDGACRAHHRFRAARLSDVFGTRMLSRIEERASELDYTLVIKRTLRARGTGRPWRSRCSPCGVRG